MKIKVLKQKPAKTLDSVLNSTSSSKKKENNNLYLTKAKNFRDKGKTQEALIAYLCSLELEPNNFNNHKEIGTTLFDQGKYKESILFFQKAISLKPRNAWIHLHLGKSLQKLGDIQKAIIAYKKAIDLNPQCYGANIELAQIFKDKQKYDVAINYYQKAINSNNNSIEANLGLADCLSKQDRFKQAIRHYAKAAYNNTISLYPELKNNYESNPTSQPNFLIIGTPKGGTTSLYSYLVKHPQVIPCLKKEVHFWPWRSYRGKEWYLSHFPRIPANSNYITGEATTDFFDRSGVANEVYESFPKVKAIAILRNPIDRAISQYYHWVRLGWEKRSLEEVIKADIELLTTNPEKRIIDKLSWKNYLPRGIYIELIREWLEIFPSEQILFLKSEEFYAQPQEIMSKVFKYLDLPEYKLAGYKKCNSGSYPELSKTIYNQLQNIFAPYNQELSEVLGHDFNW